MTFLSALRAGLRPDKPRDHTLDALRGLSALVVLTSHTHLTFLQGLPFDLGKFGICMFFLISGYIIPNSFASFDSRSSGAAGFMIKRFFRLYPAFWVSVLLGMTMPFYWHAFPAGHDIAANLTMIPMMLRSYNLLGVYWTLQFELTFYAICLALFIFGTLHRESTAWRCMTAFLALGLVLAAARFHFEQKLPVVFPLSLAAMFLGNVLRHYHKRASQRGAVIALVVFIGCETLITGLGYYKELGDPMAIGWVAYAASYAFAALAFYIVMFRGRIASPSMFILGTISYSIYLIHLIVLSWIDWAVQWALPELIVTEGVATQLLRLGAAIVASVVISIFLYEYVEHPSIRLGRAIARRVQAKLTRAAPVAIGP